MFAPRAGGGRYEENNPDTGDVGFDNRGSLANANVSQLPEEEIENLLQTFQSEDTYEKKTFSRIVVENFLSKFKFYNPRRDVPNAPSLSKAYAYYEHITLPRHFVGQQTATHVKRRAEPGESHQPTELFSPFFTKSSTFIEWGIGVDLYFSTVRAMSLVLLLAGLIHLPNMLFFASTDYDRERGSISEDFSLKLSAICSARKWVACLDCQEEWVADEDPTSFGTDGNGTYFVQRNDCSQDLLPYGILNLVVLFLLIGIVLFISLYLRAREVRFNEDKMTSTDYSVIVKNPPKDAYDPDEWRDFFAQFAEKQVTAVTVALSNEVMLRKLIARRIHRDNLRVVLLKGTDMDNEDVVRLAVDELVRQRMQEPRGIIARIFGCTVVPILNIFNMLLPPEVLVDRVFKLTEEIKELQKEKFDVARVFVTFETEEGQRAALSALAVGRFDIMMNKVSAISPSALFKGKILRVGEPSEPSAVRWLDLGASSNFKVFVRCANLVATCGLIAISGVIVDRARRSFGPWAGAQLISIFNAIIPLLVKILMIFEPHGTEGSFQAALYTKITLFRWVNTALLIHLITPFTSTLDSGDKDVLPQINALLWSELYTVPLLRLLDLFGNVKKHILAPRALTQEQMNRNFQGTKYNLGERYTDLTKVMFMCFYYSTLYPAAFFFGTAILLVQYYVDKFCLMRIWASASSIGPELARFSRQYFFSGAVLAYAIVGAYSWAGFPYDNLCDSEKARLVPAGDVTIQLGNGVTTEINVEEHREVVFCEQSFKGFSGFLFPPTSTKQPDALQWMSDEQETLTDIYGYTALACLIGFIVLYFGNAIMNWLFSWFRGVYNPSGQKQNIDFSSNTGILGYVPQVKINGFPFPFLACDIDYIDQSLIGWNDPTHSYDHHNVIFDVPWKGQPRTKMIETNTRDRTIIRDQSEYQENFHRSDNPDAQPIQKVKPLFSVMKHYPPPWKKKLSQENQS